MKLLLTIVASLVGLAAFANGADRYRLGPGRDVPYRLESECSFNDCAHSGWETNVWDSDLTSQTQCKANDCFRNGWVTIDSNGNKMDVTCNQGDCFTAGWTDTQTTHGVTVTGTVSCANGSCLTSGWTRKLDSGDSVETVCNNGDCAHYGWDSGGNGHTAVAGCKLSDCFENGWTVDVY